jgi:hypothetical protein
MTEYRKGEGGNNIPSRSPRVFQKADGFWYFLTREKTEVGPFATDEVASEGVEQYAGFAQDVDKVYLSDVAIPVGEGMSEWAVPVAPALEREPVFPAERAQDQENVSENDDRRMRFYSSRLFMRDGAWYFFTREGRDIGPFELQSEAEAALTHYVEFARELEREIQEAYQEDALKQNPDAEEGESEAQPPSGI